MLKSQLTDLGLKGYRLVTRMKKREGERDSALDNEVEYAFCICEQLK